MIIINGIKTNQYAEPIIKQSINELDKLSFKLPNELIANANNEDAVIYKGHSYTIKEIDNNKVYCVYDVDELLEIYIESKILTALTIKDNMDKLLEGSGWTCEGDNSENRKAFTFNNTNIYDAVMEMAEKYDYEVRFDNVLKKVYFAAELGSDKGAYAAEGLNLSAFNVNRSTYGYATRIEPRGQDGMTIAEVNGGVTYLENKSVTDKTITFYWEDNRYTIKEKLKEAAEKKLKELAEIKTTYEINITDLAALSDKYSILEYGLGDTIRVIGKEVKQRIVALERHDYDPTKNKCTLASAAVRLSSTTDDIRKEILTNYEITSTNLWLLDDEIKSRVKTEKYEQDQKELGSTLTTMQSDIVQNAEGITSRVSKTEILTDPEIQEALKGDDGEDAVTVHIDSVSGNIFKNSSIATTLVVSIIKGEDWIQNSIDLKKMYGNTAYIQWREKKFGTLAYVDLLNSDSRLSDNGFLLTISANDIETKSTFKCDLEIGD